MARLGHSARVAALKQTKITMKRQLLLLSLLGTATVTLSAQHEHAPTPPVTDTACTPSERDVCDDAEVDMSSLPRDPEGGMGSGTSRLPVESPMHAFHLERGSWRGMIHGSLFVRYSAQDVFDSGQRGDRTIDSPNWFMLAADRHGPASGRLAVRSMVTLDPITIGRKGYPLLFQTGESLDGEALVDRQHPHDLIAELSISYSVPLASRWELFAYVGLPGEPALGPPAFMHRPSAEYNPDAPLSHHWQDATHIVFGVTTLGIRYGAFQLDGSIFTGREPDDNRYGFDRPSFDSYAGRLSINPTSRSAFQLSRGYIRRPELLEPGIDKIRTTASVLYGAPIGTHGLWSWSLVWGMNETRSDHDGQTHGHGTQHTVLAETSLELGKHALYARAEWVQKSPGELGLAEVVDRERLNIGAVTMGSARQVGTTGGLRFSTGAQATLYLYPEVLDPHYGARPISGQVYLRITPSGSRY